MGAAPLFGCAPASDAPPGGPGDPVQPPEQARSVDIDLTDQRQRIRGFGASSAWTAPALSDEIADAFFSRQDGIGLSLLRIQIKPSGESTELATVDAAVTRGAEVWAAPWSPPGDWKTNGTTQNGGELLSEHQADWAARLADFAAFMADRGTPLLGISAQNEPDFTAEWDTCRFTPEELAAFVGDHLAPALAALDTPVPVIAPEAANWGSIERYSEALLAYEPAFESLLAFATHGYGNLASWDYPAIREADSELWLTEISDEGGNGPDSGMNSALRVARVVHDDLTVGQVSAWHYWWLLPRGDVEDTNAALADRNFELTKRAYALGHYSKFVRPGYHRVGATRSPVQEVFSSAYSNPNADEVVVVLVSDRTSALEQEVRVNDHAIAHADLWVTDEERALETSNAVSIAEGVAQLTLAPKSLATLVLRLEQ